MWCHLHVAFLISSTRCSHESFLEYSSESVWGKAGRGKTIKWIGHRDYRSWRPPVLYWRLWNATLALVSRARNLWKASFLLVLIIQYCDAGLILSAISGRQAHLLFQGLQSREFWQSATDSISLSKVFFGTNILRRRPCPHAIASA